MPLSGEPADDLRGQEWPDRAGDSAMGGTGLEPVPSCL